MQAAGGGPKKLKAKPEAATAEAVSRRSSSKLSSCHWSRQERKAPGLLLSKRAQAAASNRQSGHPVGYCAW